MPCLNEEETVGQAVKEARNAIVINDITEGEVLVIDNGSTDCSALKAQAAGARVISEPHKGYGAALKTGIREAQGKWILMGDCDLSYDFSCLPKFLEELHHARNA